MGVGLFGVNVLRAGSAQMVSGNVPRITLGDDSTATYHVQRDPNPDFSNESFALSAGNGDGAKATLNSGFSINVTYDSSVRSAPTGFISAIQQAVSSLEADFSNPVTLNINVGWGEVVGDPDPITQGAESISTVENYTYSQIRGALLNGTQPIQQQADQFLPLISPFSTGQCWIPIAEAQALGLPLDESATPKNAVTIDGSIGFSNVDDWSFTGQSTPPGSEDLVGYAEHEITEVMGRISDLDDAGEYSVMDLFRYRASGVRDTVAGGVNSTAYFSIDNGVSGLGYWNNYLNPGNQADLGDWVGAGSPLTNDSFSSYVPGDSTTINGQAQGGPSPVSQNDLALMNVLGWNTSATPNPIVIPSLGIVIVGAGQTYAVYYGQSDTGDIVQFGGTETIYSGGSVYNAVVYGGGTEIVETGGAASGATVLSGGKLVVSGGSVNGLAISDGAELSDGGDFAANGSSVTTVAGRGEDVSGAGEQDIFVTLADGQLAFWRLDGAGDLTSGLALTVGGAPLTIGGGTSVVGGGEDLLASGGKDVFVRLSSGQLIFWQFDPNGGLTNGVAFTVNGAPLTIDGGTSVVGGGEDFLGTDQKDVFLRTSSGQLILWQFGDSGRFAGGLGLAANGGPLTIDTGTSVVGGGEDFLGAGQKDVFVRLSSGQLIFWQFDARGVLTYGIAFTADGDPLTIDSGTSVVGGGEDFLGKGKKDVFARLSNGQLTLWQFDGTGQLSGSIPFTVNGGPLTIDTTTSVVGGGEDFFASGGKDAFLRTANGQLILWQFNANGGFTYGVVFTVNGAPLTIDTATSVIGGGEDFFGSGGKDLFLRTSSGQLIVWQFNISGQFTGGLGLTANGAPLAIDTATSVVGGGEDLLTSGGRDLFLRTASGQLILWQFDGLDQFTYGIAFTANGGAFIIDSATTVVGAGHDSANGDMALKLQYGNGQTALFDLTGSALTPAPSGAVLNAQAFEMSEIAGPKTAIDTLNSGTESPAGIGATPDLSSAFDGTLSRLIQAMASQPSSNAPLDLAGVTLTATDIASRYALAAHH